MLNVTNENSIGWAIADLAQQHGATVGVGALNEKMAERVARLIDGRERMQCHIVDFQYDEQMEALAETVASTYGKIDFLVHSAAFANKDDLQGRFIDTSLDGFKLALDISAYSLVRVCKILEPVLADEGSIITMSYLGSTRAADNYNIMGVAKAALEACVRYLAKDLGPRGIRVNTVSPGPINTISARGVKNLGDMISHVQHRAPLKRPYGQEETAGTSVYLLSDLSKAVTGQIIFVDSGYNIAGV